MISTVAVFRMGFPGFGRMRVMRMTAVMVMIMVKMRCLVKNTPVFRNVKPLGENKHRKRRQPKGAEMSGGTHCQFR